LLGESVERIRALRYRNGYTPEGGFQVMNDWSALPGVVEYGRSPAFAAYARAAAQLGAAEDHLLGLDMLLRDGRTSLAPYASARAAIEAIGRARLLINKGGSATVRAGLAYAERLEELKALSRFIPIEVPDAQEAKASRQALSEAIRQLRATARTERIPILSYPSFSDAFRAALATQDDKLRGAEVAARHSAISHGLTHALLDIAATGPKGWEHPFNVGSSTLDPGSVLDLIITPLGAFLPTVSEQIAAYGWPPSSWELWRGHVRSVLRHQLSDLEQGTLRTGTRPCASCAAPPAAASAFARAAY
jgi:hypothetical protein